MEWWSGGELENWSGGVLECWSVDVSRNGAISVDTRFQKFCRRLSGVSTTPPLHLTPLLHYSITPLLHRSISCLFTGAPLLI